MNHSPLQITTADYVLGPGNAAVTLIEYSDFECPYCARAYPVTRRLVNESDGRLRLAYRHFPLVHLHRHAELAARAATAAGCQDRFWPMHDFLFENRDDIDYGELPNYASGLGLDVERFVRDLASERVTQKINHDLESGEKAGVRGTPSFFINGNLFSEPWSYESLRGAIETELAPRRHFLPFKRHARLHRHR